MVYYERVCTIDTPHEIERLVLAQIMARSAHGTFLDGSGDGRLRAGCKGLVVDESIQERIQTATL